MSYEQLRVGTTTFFCFSSCFGWLSLIFASTGWLKKVSIYYSIDASLWNVQTSEGVGSMVIGSGFGVASTEKEQAIANFQLRTFGMQEFREYMCQLPGVLGAICPIWSTIQMYSWTFTVMILLILVVFSAGGCLDLYHHFVISRTKTRKWVRLLYGLSPIFFVVALTQYCFMASRLADMFPATEASVLGRNVSIGWLLCMISALPWGVNTVMGKMSVTEELTEHLSAQKHFLREAGMNQYGATGMHHGMHPGAGYGGGGQDMGFGQALHEHRGATGHTAAMLQQERFPGQMDAQYGGQYGGQYGNAMPMSAPMRPQRAYDGQAEGVIQPQARGAQPTWWGAQALESFLGPPDTAQFEMPTRPDAPMQPAAPMQRAF